MIKKTIQGEEFIFDERSLSYFEDFKEDGRYDVGIESGYLGRKGKFGRRAFQWFHTWYYDEVDILVSGRQVHHINTNRKDNRFDNLIDLTPKEHEFVHRYQIWKKKKFKNKEEIRKFIAELKYNVQEQLTKPEGTKRKRKEKREINEFDWVSFSVLFILLPILFFPTLIFVFGLNIITALFLNAVVSYLLAKYLI